MGVERRKFFKRTEIAAAILSAGVLFVSPSIIIKRHSDHKFNTQMDAAEEMARPIRDFFKRAPITPAPEPPKAEEPFP